MPEEAHRGLVKSAVKKRLKGEDFDRYVYGGLVNIEKRKKNKLTKREKEVARP